MINLIGVSGKLNSGKDTVAQMIQYLSSYEIAPANPIYQSGFEETLKYSKEDTDWNKTFWKKGEHGGWKIKRFADELKDTVCRWIGCTREQLEDREFKEKPLGEEWNRYIVEEYNEIYGYSEKIFATSKEGDEYVETRQKQADQNEHPSFKTRWMGLSPRKMMQLLGTEAGRQIIHPNIWVNALFSNYKGRKDHFSVAKEKYFDFPNWIIPDTRFPNEAKAIKDRNGVLIRVNRKNFTKDGRYEVVHDPVENPHPSETALDDYTDWDYIIENDGSLEELLSKVKQIYSEINNV